MIAEQEPRRRSCRARSTRRFPCIWSAPTTRTNEGQIIPDEMWIPAVAEDRRQVLRRQRREEPARRDRRHRPGVDRHHPGQAVQQPAAALRGLRAGRGRPVDGCRAAEAGRTRTSRGSPDGEAMLKTVVGRLVLAVVAVAAGIICWNQSRRASIAPPTPTSASPRCTTIATTASAWRRRCGRARPGRCRDQRALDADARAGRASDANRPPSPIGARVRHADRSHRARRCGRRRRRDDPALMLLAANAAFRPGAGQRGRPHPDGRAARRRHLHVRRRAARGARRSPTPRSTTSTRRGSATRSPAGRPMSRGARARAAAEAMTPPMPSVDLPIGPDASTAGRAARRRRSRAASSRPSRRCRTTSARRPTRAAARRRGAAASDVLPRIDFEQITFAEPEYLWLLVAARRCSSLLWVWRFLQRRADIAPSRRAPHAAVARALRPRRRPAVLAVPDRPRSRCLIVALAAAARPGHRHAAGRHRSGHPAGRLGLDAGQGRPRRSLAALDAVPPPARRFAELEERSHRAGALRAHRRAADPAHDRSEHVLLLPRPPRRRSRRSGSTTRRPGTRTSSWASTGASGMIERDEELHGRSSNAQLFVVISDGESWSGEVAEVAEARHRPPHPGLRRRRRHARRRPDAGVRRPGRRRRRAGPRHPALLAARSRRAPEDRARRRRPVLRARSRRRSPHRQRHHRHRQAPRAVARRHRRSRRAVLAIPRRCGVLRRRRRRSSSASAPSSGFS